MYKAGVIGLSGIGARESSPSLGYALGKRHAGSHLAGYAEIPNVEVVGICDLNPSLLGETVSKWSASWPNLKGYEDYREMLSAADLDLVSVVTPDNRHAEIVVDAAKAGIKGILCEKPIATSLADADRMIEAVEQAGASMTVEYTRRWNPEYIEARRLIQEGAIGEVKYADFYFTGPRAMLFRNGSHFIDIFNFLIQSEPEWVSAVLPAPFETYGPRYAGDGGRDPMGDPACSATLGFPGGVRAGVHLIRRERTLAEVRIVGEQGAIRFLEDGGGKPVAELQQLDERGRAFVRPFDRTQFEHSTLGAAIRELIGLVEGKVSASSSPPAEARKTLSTLLGILQSHHLGKRIDLPTSDV